MLMRRTARSLRYYLLGLSLIALLTTLGHQLIDAVIRQNEVYASVVNLAGRQRMLSQRVALAAETMGKDNQIFSPSEAALLIDEMEAAHQALALGAQNSLLPGKAPSDPRLDAIYLSPGGLNADMGAFLAAAREVIADPGSHAAQLEQVMGLSRDALLTQLDQAVSVYQLMSEERTARAEMASTLLWLATLAMLILEWFLIFRPQHKLSVEALETIEQQKEVLAGEQARYELAAEAASFGVWEQPDIQSNRLITTPTFATVTGYDVADLPQTRSQFLSLIHYADVASTRAVLFGPPKSGRERSRIEHRILCADGQFRWFMTVGEHRPSENGRAFRFIAYSVDIQERKRAEEITASLAASETDASSSSPPRKHG